MADTSLRQRLRFELSSLDNRDLEGFAVGGVRLVLQDLRGHCPQIRAALQELLAGTAYVQCMGVFMCSHDKTPCLTSWLCRA